ncbi:uncharacterized protein RAG0_14846 [Rhynchosporium agropyri]|uniref:Uncharacterized protein n=1 Tax=Rhynchosporium agropyri TaxID=914238 RepID=A0A1E1LIQ0_9HELO|nr:uncharacterized protein RAG0_14846 [Rhynchosporium agropyri]
MRFTSTASALVLGAAAVLAKELPKDELKAVAYDSGDVMENMMMKKFAHWDAELEAGAMNSAQWPRLNWTTKCVDGIAAAIPGDPHHTFRCKNTDLYDFINHATLGSPISDSAGRTGSSAWGWTDPKSGREFAVSGMYQGAAFIEILKTGRMKELAFLPPAAPLNRNALWKEIRPYKNFMLIGSELEKSGVQIFDMSKLLTIDASAGPVLLSQSELTGHFTDLPTGRSHNVVVNEELNYAVAVGAAPRNDSCGAGLIFFDLTDPANPTRMGCDGSDGYVHDAQCLVYRGPDVKYQGRDICYGYNEDTLTIYDVTDKKASKIISRTSYEGATYTHQGWVNDKNWQEYLFLDDEIDEEEFAGPAKDQYPVTYIFDIRNLEAPKQTGLYKAANVGIDHNQYVIDGLIYQASYGSGLRVYDVSSIKDDPTGNSVCEVAFFDIFPEDDFHPGGGEAVYSGTWATYAYFPSGFIFINTIERGAFVVKINKKETCKPKTCLADNCLRALRATSVPGRLEESKEFCGNFTKTFVADVTLVKDYALVACPGNVISRVSSACSCVQTTSAA